MFLSTYFGVPAMSGVFNVLFDNVVKELRNYVDKKANVDPCALHLKLKTTMLALSAVLNDAKERQITNLVVLEWLEELTSVIYDAEDLQDDIETEVLISKIRAESQMSPPLDNVAVGNDQVPNSASSNSSDVNHLDLGPLANHLDLGSLAAKLFELCDRLDVFLPQVTVLGLRESLKIIENKTSHLPFAGSMYKGTLKVGRESERTEIMSFLMAPHNTSGVRLVVIAGSAGVGKTTLARVAYDDEMLNGAFDFKSWVSVSAAVNSNWVIKEILWSITNRDAPTGHIESLEARLSKALLGVKLLLILDDLENVEQTFWDDLCRPLKAGPKSVTIVITRRDNHVSLDNFCSHLILQLNRLSNEDCWSLLKDVVFESEEAPTDEARHEIEEAPTDEARQDIEEAPIDEALQKFGKQIAKKCNGSPLAAKLLGGILRYTRDADDWDSILRSKVWHSTCYPGDIFPALRLSYSYLPSHLKRCFSYCSIFPKNYKFEMEKLVSLWIAEGFVQASKNEASLEEVGNSYFQELFNRSLFQQSSSDRSPFEMHDLVHDLAKHVSSDICFMFKADSPQVCPSKIRHFSFIQTKHDIFKYLQAIDGLVHFGNLRTFLPLKAPLTNLCCLDNEQAQCFFLRFLSLRVLSLSHYNINEIPQSLSSLKHLRFLDLSRTSIIHLSPIVCDLYNLHTLLLQDCPYLTNLPEKLGNLVSLRHLDISGSNKLQGMPGDVSKLNKVHTLTSFVVSKDRGAKLSALAMFHNLRGHLSILGLQNVVSETDASEAKMKTKMHLDELTLEWGDVTQAPPQQAQTQQAPPQQAQIQQLSPQQAQTQQAPPQQAQTQQAPPQQAQTQQPPTQQAQRQLQAPPQQAQTQQAQAQEKVCRLLEPSSSLKKIIISSYGGTKLAKWIGSVAYCDIVSVSLINCYQCSCLPSLGQLPSLKKVHIAKFPMLHIVGREFYANDSSPIIPFRALETLKIEKMLEWKVWSPWLDNVATFSRLQELCLEDCPKLSEHLPINLPSLLKLEVKNCCELTGLLPQLPAIRKLRLHECKRLEFTSISTLTSLVSLDIRGVSLNHSLASDLHALNSLLELNLASFIDSQNPMMLSNYGDNNIQLVPGYTMLIGESIRDLSIQSCAFQLICPELRSLNISHCKNLEFNVNHFSSLQSLVISHCAFRESFPLGDFPELKHLKIEQCSNLKKISLLQLTTSLPLFELSIISCHNLLTFPNQGLPTPDLSSLSINNCKRLKRLPSVMNNLTSLQLLSVVSCQELEPIPAGGLPPNLHTLCINSCPNLFTCQTAWKPPASIQQLYLDIPLHG